MRLILALVPTALLAACAGMAVNNVQPGQTEAEVLQRLGTPTARYALEAGAQRIEYATGPEGRTTWMVDVDATGRVKALSQVLSSEHFADFQGRAPGMTRDALLREMGTPGMRRVVRYPAGEVWGWRFPTNDCLLFEVSVGTDGKVVDAVYNIDPRCDHPNDGKS